VLSPIGSGEAASLAKQGLRELETIITNTEALGVNVIGYSSFYLYV